MNINERKFNVNDVSRMLGISPNSGPKYIERFLGGNREYTLKTITKRTFVTEKGLAHLVEILNIPVIGKRIEEYLNGKDFSEVIMKIPDAAKAMVLSPSTIRNLMQEHLGDDNREYSFRLGEKGPVYITEKGLRHLSQLYWGNANLVEKFIQDKKSATLRGC